jgi:Holliday junction resolvasome RuvABC endonuclease subunit
MVNVLGLDLSLAAPGFCWGSLPAEMATLKPRSDGDRRLCEIRDAVCNLVLGGSINLAVIEDVPRYATSSMALTEVRGIVKGVLLDYNVPYAFVAPAALKVYACGSGTVGKTDMIDAAEKMLGHRPADDNAADAWWLRHVGLTALAGAAGLDPGQTRVLSAVDWPELVKPYGRIQLDRKSKRKLCRHRYRALLHAGHWIHPFSLDVCDKPPKSPVKRGAPGQL